MAVLPLFFVDSNIFYIEIIFSFCYTTIKAYILLFNQRKLFYFLRNFNEFYAFIFNNNL